MGDDVSRATKGIINPIMLSKAKMASTNTAATTRSDVIAVIKERCKLAYAK
jgi:hypothetical protein